MPFLFFSKLYPTILVPPVSHGGLHARLMQSLKALITLGAVGAPGYPVGGVDEVIHCFVHLLQFLYSHQARWKNIRVQDNTC